MSKSKRKIIEVDLTKDDFDDPFSYTKLLGHYFNGKCSKSLKSSSKKKACNNIRRNLYYLIMDTENFDIEELQFRNDLETICAANKPPIGVKRNEINDTIDTLKSVIDGDIVLEGYI